ncbi:MAG: acyl-ACP--UDP-N-acetylglucosamine O-acyltransferase [Candidatus Coatesbacteria bacterium]|nr:MAG: acyl-ACP--UDP-N-acetylglucosamine O-acyltransferase [Candidatus Coatesbacteria bacterium]
MAEIHETAIVDGRAELGADVAVGPYAIIDGPVLLGAGTTVGPHAVIEGPATFGEGCRIFSHAVLGTIPQDLKFEGEEATIEVGAGTTIREFVTLNRGTKAAGATRLGENCLLMAYAHVAHDCILADNVVLANAATLAGHVEVGEYAFIGGLSAVHQFTRIGKHAYIGGMSRVSQDIIPYALVASEPTRVAGINAVGLQRRGFSAEVRNALKKAYHFIYREDLNTNQALEKLRGELSGVAEVGDIIAFLEASERGILK